MKQLLIILALFTLFSCKKPTEDLELFNEPIPVHFKVNSSTNALKKVHAELWACDQYGENKTLVGIENAVVAGSVDITMTQNVIPYIYCYTSFTVTSDTFDIQSVSIETDKRVIRMNGSSCHTNHFEYEMMFSDISPKTITNYLH